MEERIKTFVFKGKEIVYFDFRGLTEDQDVIDLLHKARDYTLQLGHPNLQLTNVTGVYFTPAVMKNIGILNETEHLVIKDALVGVTGAKRILFQIYSTIVKGKTKAFDDEDSAKEWLIEE